MKIYIILFLTCLIYSCHNQNEIFYGPLLNNHSINIIDYWHKGFNQLDSNFIFETDTLNSNGLKKIPKHLSLNILLDKFNIIDILKTDDSIIYLYVTIGKQDFIGNYEIHGNVEVPSFSNVEKIITYTDSKDNLKSSIVYSIVDMGDIVKNNSIVGKRLLKTEVICTSDNFEKIKIEIVQKINTKKIKDRLEEDISLKFRVKHGMR